MLQWISAWFADVRALVCATLSAEEANRLFVPRGFAHGFCSLELGGKAVYKVNACYAPQRDAWAL